jgi:8-oxo-dGTP pyrophosphatase MutT (NUDIX family)
MKMQKYMIESKQMSAAVVFTDGIHFLAGHPFLGTYLDLPKGLIDPGESALNAAIREFHEETSFDISRYRNELIRVGIYPYRKYKDICVFLLKMEELPPISTFKCTSMFFSPVINKKAPEVDHFYYKSFDDLSKFIAPMRAILIDVQQKYLEV